MTIEGRQAQSYNQKLQQVECVTTADDVWATLKICQDATQQQLVPLWSWNSGCWPQEHLQLERRCGVNWAQVQFQICLNVL